MQLDNISHMCHNKDVFARLIRPCQLCEQRNGTHRQPSIINGVLQNPYSGSCEPTSAKLFLTQASPPLSPSQIRAHTLHTFYIKYVWHNPLTSSILDTVILEYSRFLHVAEILLQQICSYS